MWELPNAEPAALANNVTPGGNVVWADLCKGAVTHHKHLSPLCFPPAPSASTHTELLGTHSPGLPWDHWSAAVISSGIKSLKNTKSLLTILIQIFLNTLWLSTLKKAFPRRKSRMNQPSLHRICSLFQETSELAWASMALSLTSP